jgi:hypothetical protein
MMQDARERESPSDVDQEATHNILTQDIPLPIKFVRPWVGGEAPLKATFKPKLLFVPSVLPDPDKLPIKVCNSSSVHNQAESWVLAIHIRGEEWYDTHQCSKAEIWTASVECTKASNTQKSTTLLIQTTTHQRLQPHENIKTGKWVAAYSHLISNINVKKEIQLTMNKLLGMEHDKMAPNIPPLPPPPQDDLNWTRTFYTFHDALFGQSQMWLELSTIQVVPHSSPSTSFWRTGNFLGQTTAKHTLKGGEWV